jgi:HAD superfamily hydrolase (TIGR01484 family)
VDSLEHLPKKEVRELFAVCFDVDDTVTTDGTLDPEAYASLFALRASGLKLVAATGRPLGFAEIIARTWPVDAAVGENGAGFFARVGKELRAGYWDAPAVRSAQQQRLGAIRERVARELPDVLVSSDSWARRCDLAFDIGEHQVVPQHELEALVAIIVDEGANASVSSIHAHAQLGSHDKARGIVHAAGELWGLSEERCRTEFAFVGDSGNDAAAFAFFALTAGVANVQRHLSRLPIAPKFVATLGCGAGFAEVARALLALRSQST